MWFYSIILALALSLSDFQAPRIILKFSEKLHSYCLKYVPKAKYHHLTQAVVCGNDSEIPTEENHLLRNSGLIHLIVVSASHLLFLDFIMAYFKMPSTIRLILLFLYSCITLLQAPALRSLIQMVLEKMNLRQIFSFSSLEISLLSILILLVFLPENIHSFSALLSYSAALASTRHSKHMLKHTSTYFILLPVLVCLSLPHPISILFNFVFAPIIGFILFPLSILSFVLPLSEGLDLFWNYFLEILNSLILPLTPYQFKIPILFLWIYIISWNLILILKEKNERICSVSEFFTSFDGNSNKA